MEQAFTEPINSNDQSLDRVLAAGLPVVLVFENGANPLDDVLNRLARENAGQLLVVKINAADNPASARRFQAPSASLPALFTLKGGQTLSQAGPASPGGLEKPIATLPGQRPQPGPKRPPP